MVVAEQDGELVRSETPSWRRRGRDGLRTDTPSRSAIWRLGSPLAGDDGGQGRCAAPSQDLASRWARVVEAWVRRGEGPVNLGGQ